MPPSCCAFGRVHPFVLPALAALLALAARAEQADGGAGETIEIAGARPAGSARAPGAASTVVEVADFGGEVRSVAELLATAPGVAIHASGGPGQAASLSLRGASADESLVLLDGIPLRGPGGGAIDLSTLPASLLQRMVVSRGVLGAELGAGALGGAVELQPRASRGAALSASYGSFGTAQAAAEASAGSTLFGIQLDRTRGDYDYAARVPPEAPTWYGFTRQNADGLRGSLLLRTEASLSPSTELDLLLQGTAGDHGLPGPSSATTLRSRALDQGGVAGARLSGESGEVAWSARAWARADRLELCGVQLFSDCADGAPDCPRADERSTAARAQAQLAVPLGRTQRLRAELEGGEDWIAGAPTGSHRRATASLALSDDIALPRGLALHPALRLDRSGGDTALSPGVEITAQPAPPLVLRAGAGLSFRPASFSELYLDQGGVLPNDALSPERAWSADAGVAFHTPALTLTGDLFWSSYSNLIVYGYFPPARVKPFNAGGARIAGLEAQAVAKLPLGLTGELSYSFLDAINGRSGFTGHHLAYRPPHRLFARLARRGDRFEGYGEVSLQSRMPRNGFDTAFVGAQTLVNAGAGVRVAGPLWVDLEAKNLLDDQTLEDLFQYPLPGLSLAVIARARL